MAIRGVITSPDVLLKGPTILREFGPRAYFRCVALLLHRPSTFLECVFP
jgi:hypothetical protein